MEALKSPPELTLGLTPAEDWRKWKERYLLFAEACGATAFPMARQKATFLHLVGEEGQALYKTFEFTQIVNEIAVPIEGNALTMAIILEKFDSHFKPYLNLTYVRYQFNTCEQGTRPFDEYFTDLKLKSKDCEYGDLRDSMIRDRIVCGITNHNLRERLLRELNLDLNKTAQICRAAETSRAQVKLMKGEKPIEEPKEIQQLKTKWTKKTPDRKSTTPAGKGYKQFYSSQSRQCKWCGGQHQPKACPAYGKTCKKCNKQNHFAKVCQQKKVHSLSTNGSAAYGVEQNSSDDESDMMFMGQLDVTCINRQQDCWIEEIQINAKTLPFKIDTGAQADVIPWSLVKQLYPKVKIEPTKAILIAYAGQRIIPRGKCMVTAEYKGQRIQINPIVADIQAQPLLGLTTSEKLGLVRRCSTDALNEEPQVCEDPKAIIDAYADVFTGLGEFKGEHDFVLEPNATPTVATPRRIPHALRPAVKTELERMEQLGIIKKVDEPPDWSHHMVIVHKPGGGLRICIDPQHLNENIKSKNIQMPTCEEITARMKGAKYFTVLDANLAFWHKKLTKRSSYMATMATPYGNYRFLRLPFGVKTGPEIFQEAMNDLFGEEEGIAPHEDDIILWGRDLAEHNTRLRRALQIARDNDLRLTKKKIQLAKTEVKYLRHLITAQGVKPDPEKVETVRSIHEPQSKQELQRLLGLLTYLGKFIPNLSEDTAYMRNLLKLDDRDWKWTDKAANDFQTVKDKLLTAPVLQYYDATAPIQLYVDASKNGLGSVLVQNQKPITFASTTLTETQKRYAQIEKEMLAILHGCNRFHTFVYGHNFQVFTDHKPLVAIMKKPLDKISPRLQRIRLRLQRYTFRLDYIPGKEMGAADTLSITPNENVMMGTTEDDLQILQMVKTIPASDRMKQKIKQETQSDEEMQAVIRMVMRGWPADKRDAEEPTKKYWQVREDLHYVEGFLCKGTAIVIPPNLRSSIMERIHETHQGISQARCRYKDTVYWPGITKQVDEQVKSCHYCQTFQKANQVEPLTPHEIPERPWQKLAVDLFELQTKKYLLVTDYLSKYTEMMSMTRTRAKEVIDALKAVNARHGIPMQIISDGGPPFNSNELADYMAEWDIEHIMTSPYYPRSNGLIERHIQTVKSQLKKTVEAGGDPYVCLMNLRATPSEGQPSPAEILMGRRIRTKLPQMNDLLNPKPVNFGQLRTTMLDKQKQQKKYADQHAKSLTKLKPKQLVYMKMPNRWVPARVNKCAKEPNSYVVTASNGGTFRRNRWHLKPAHSSTKFPEGINIPFMDTSNFMYDDIDLEPDRQEGVLSRELATEPRNQINAEGPVRIPLEQLDPGASSTETKGRSITEKKIPVQLQREPVRSHHEDGKSNNQAG